MITKPGFHIVVTGRRVSLTVFRSQWSIWVVGNQETYFKINHCVSKLLSVNCLTIYQASVKHYNKMVFRHIKYPCSSEKENKSYSLYMHMLFESYRLTSKFINSIWCTKGLCQQFMFLIFDGLEKFTFLRSVRESKPWIFLLFSKSKL